MQKANMQYEGTFRQHILKWDNYEDIAFYGIIKADYNGKKLPYLL
jgi:ribosomal-protein-alanine N-acetyltransferase